MKQLRAKPKPEETVSFNDVTFSFKDIYDVVDRFYTKVQHDELLKVPFSSVHDWPHHIDHLSHFWWVRLGGEAYIDARYNPPLKHFKAGFNEKLLARWLELFYETLKENLNSEQAHLWAITAQRMGQALNMKNEIIKRSQGLEDF